MIVIVTSHPSRRPVAFGYPRVSGLYLHRSGRSSSNTHRIPPSTSDELAPGFIAFSPGQVCQDRLAAFCQIPAGSQGTALLCIDTRGELSGSIEDPLDVGGRVLQAGQGGRAMTPLGGPRPSAPSQSPNCYAASRSISCCDQLLPFRHDSRCYSELRLKVFSHRAESRLPRAATTGAPARRGRGALQHRPPPSALPGSPPPAAASPGPGSCGRGDRNAAAGSTTQARAEAEPSIPGPRRHERAAARRIPGAVARPRRPVMGSCVSRGEDPAARDAARGGGTSARPPGSLGWVSALHGPAAPQGTRCPIGTGLGRRAGSLQSRRRSPYPTPHSAHGRWHEARSRCHAFFAAATRLPQCAWEGRMASGSFWSSYGPLSRPRSCSPRRKPS
ncbi:hypothetical protein LEMLEM_LOCUS5575 [Lemmus lemmus]